MPQDDSDEAWLTQASRRWQSPSSDGSWPDADVSAVVAEGNTEQLHAHHINNLPPAILHGIFSHLGPRELCAVSATCALWRQLNQDKCANGVWKSFYTSRWRVLDASGEDVCWQTKYGSKMKQGKSWSGKYESDNLWGHKAGVKALKLLPSQGVLLTGSLDRTIRLWDLTYGMPLSISRPHGGTVRAVALDNTLVASGSSDNVVRLWHARNSTNGATLLDPAEASAAAAAAADLDLGLAESLMELDGPADSDDQATASDQAPVGSSSGGLTAAAVAAVNASTSSRRRVGHGPYSVITGEADEGLFDLSMPGQHLRGHIGPVTSLCLTDSCLYSGSWDYSVRVWRRGSWDCVSVLKYPDWVYSVVARGGLLLVASGPEVHVHDLPTGKLVRKFQNLHEGSVSCLEGTHSGRLLFSGGADGLLMAHDLRMKEASRVLWHHNAGVNGLALEDPWLVSAASDGTVIMHNLEAALPNNFSGCIGPGSGSSTAGASSSTTSKRTLGCPGQSGPMYCVDIAESWLAAGGESPSVRTWDFTRAAEAAARAAAARASRGSSKRAAKVRKAAASGAAGAGSSSGTSGAAAAAGSKGQSGKKANRSDKAAGGISNAVASTSAAVGVAGSSAHGASAACADGSGSSSRLPRGLLAAAAAAASNAANTLSNTLPDTGAAGSSSKADRFHKLQSRRSSSKQLLQQDCAGSSAVAAGQQPGASASAPAEPAGSLGEAGAAASSSVAASSTSGHHARRSSKQRANSSSGGSSSNKGTNGGSSYGSSPSSRWQQHNAGSSCSGGGSYHGGCGTSPVQHGVWCGGTSPPVGSSRLHHTSSGRRGSNSGQGPLQQAGGRSGIPIPAARQSQPQHRLSGVHAETTAGSYEQGWHPHAASPTGVEAGTSPCYTAAAAQHARGPRADAHAGFAGDRCSAYQVGLCTDADGSLVGPSAARYHVPFSSSYPSAAQGPGPWLVPGSSPRYEVWGTTLRIAAATNCDKRLAIKRPEGAARKSSDGGAAGAVEGYAPVTVASGSISN